MRERIARILALGVLLCTLTGCGTLFGRAASSTSGPDYYRGTAHDFGLLFGSERLNRGYFPATLWCWASVACPILTLYSLPADIVVDTVALPYDIYQVHN
ncbi:conserved hypothetical protein [Pseudomonas sp. 8Z]|uniref:YceK/YidQ family lipoprotein n=1 Tax=Pseudomonas sp. 8Z TaxID=2653166 RepID=UPI0012F247E9|nr:YceK/YidQ family lipoprotein [Pseudomonas sp. 8Z]VXC46613.1 conserved hypothetical protein [Pseudomonas sp. 8Z]